MKSHSKLFTCLSAQCKFLVIDKIKEENQRHNVDTVYRVFPKKGHLLIRVLWTKIKKNMICFACEDVG